MSVNDNAVLSAHEIVLFVGCGALVRAMRAPGYAVWVLYPRHPEECSNTNEFTIIARMAVC